MSLLQGRDRPAVSVLLELDEWLAVRHFEVVASVVHVDRRLSYQQVDALLAGAECDRDRRLVPALERMHQVAEEFYGERISQGAIDLDLPEIKLHVELPKGPGEAPVIEHEVLEAGAAGRMLVAEMMIGCNALVGRWCTERNLPVIYRRQEPPSRELSSRDLAVYPEGLARTHRLLRTMQRGESGLRPEPHHGLGLEQYVQVTSPIRRYSDMVCQRQIKAALRGQPLPYDEEELLAIAGDVERASRDAQRAGAESARYWLLQALAQESAPRHLDAVVLDHEDDQGTRAEIYLEALAMRRSATLRRRHPPGTRVRVEVGRVDPRRDELYLREAD